MTLSSFQLSRGALGLAGALLLSACWGSSDVTGTGGGLLPTDSTDPGTQGPAARCEDPGAHAVPKLLRLSNYEYQQVVSDLAGAPVSRATFARWTPIAQVYGFDTMSESRIDGQGMQEQLQTAETLAKLLIDSPELQKLCPAKGAPAAPACTLKASYSPAGDFSSTQGQNCWSYKDSGGANLIYDSGIGRWRHASDTGTQVGAGIMHPGEGLNSVLRYTVPVDGALSFAGTFRDTDPGGGDGVLAVVQRNGADVWRRLIANSSQDAFDLKLNVRRGDRVDFIINKNGTTAYDTTGLETTLGLAQAPFTGAWTWDNCGQAMVERVASRAFRRPLRPEEVADYKALFDATLADGVKAEAPNAFYDSLSTVLQAALLSPNMVFKPELVPGGLDAAERDFGVASRLALFFSGSFPDDELWGLAQRGELGDGAVLKEQAARLMDQYAERFATNFGGQWLDFRPGQLPGSDPLVDAMGVEAFDVFKEVLQTQLPPQRLIKPGFTYANQALATHYKLPFTGANAESFARLDTTERGGLLSQGFFLTHTANGSEFARVIHRGLWTLTRVLCQSLPRLDQATLEEINQSVGKIDRNLPLAKQMELHRSTTSRCGGCHTQMDPIGLALENYDEKGLWRDSYPNGTPITNDFQYNGVSVANPFELAGMVEQSEEFRECVAEKLMTYALNRGPVAEELCLKTGLAKPANGTQPSLKQMTVDAILTSLKLTEVAP